MSTKEVVQNMFSFDQDYSREQFLFKAFLKVKNPYNKQSGLNKVKHNRWMNSVKEKYNVGILDKFEFIKMQNTCDPEFILWKNLSKKGERLVGRLYSISAVVFVVGLMYLIILSFKSYRKSIYADYLPILGRVGLKGLACQTMDDLTLDDAFDYTLKQQKIVDTNPDANIMTLELFCFCSN